MLRILVCVCVFLGFVIGVVAQSGIDYNLPLFVFETDGDTIVDEPKKHVRLKIIDNVHEANSPEDDPNVFLGYAGVELRGHTSLSFKKKQYDIELRDSSGNEKSLSLFGMPKESDWVLNGPYADKSLIRNALVYELASGSNVLAPRTRFCEVVINDEYLGVYVLSEKIKRDKYRVDVLKQEDDDDSSSASFIVKFDRKSNDFYVYLPFSKVGVQVVYPKANQITQEHFQYIKSYFYAFDNYFATNSISKIEAPFVLDTSSFIDYFIFSELSKNIDSYRLSTFLYKDSDSRSNTLMCGPLWDYNLAFGNANYYNGYTYEGFIADSSRWFSVLLSNPAFCNKIGKRWVELRNSTLSVDHVFGVIDSLVYEIGGSVNSNFNRWNILDRYIWPNYFVGSSYDQEIDYLKNYILNRMIWLDHNMLGDTSEEIKIVYKFELYSNMIDNTINFRLDLEKPSYVEVMLYSNKGVKVGTILTKSAFDKGVFISNNNCSFLNRLSHGIYIVVVLINDVPVEKCLIYK